MKTLESRLDNESIDISKHPMLKKCYEVVSAIEKCGNEDKIIKALNISNYLFKELDEYITLINEVNDLYDIDQDRIKKQILEIPTRTESMGGQNYKYVRLEEVINVLFPGEQS